jgi:hypothetical protein
MNYLNNDFDQLTETKLDGVQELRKYYLSTLTPISSPHLGAHDLEGDHDYVDDLKKGKAGSFCKLFWNTVVLSERSAKNYLRNPLAYGVRVGMYAGEHFYMNFVKRKLEF